jgi:hypothetical protein
MRGGRFRYKLRPTAFGEGVEDPMSDAVEHLKWLCSSDAERLSDCERINQFVKAGLDVIEQVEARRESGRQSAIPPLCERCGRGHNIGNPCYVPGSPAKGLKIR